MTSIAEIKARLNNLRPLGILNNGVRGGPTKESFDDFHEQAESDIRYLLEQVAELQADFERLSERAEEQRLAGDNEISLLESKIKTQDTANSQLRDHLQIVIGFVDYDRMGPFALDELARARAAL